MTSNMKMFSLTHVISVLSGAAVAITYTVEYFMHVGSNFNAGNLFMGTLVPMSYAGVIGYYAFSLKATASGITETTTPSAPPKA